MAGIKGSIYVILGVAIAGYSKFAPNNDEPFLNIFFYIGIVFIAWGVIKMIFAPSNRRKRVLTNQPKMGQDIFCPRCNGKNTYYSKFCHLCGYRLR